MVGSKPTVATCKRCGHEMFKRIDKIKHHLKKCKGTICVEKVDDEIRAIEEDEELDDHLIRPASGLSEASTALGASFITTPSESDDY